MHVWGRRPAQPAALAVALDRGCALVGGNARGRGDPGAVRMRIGSEDGWLEFNRAVAEGYQYDWGSEFDCSPFKHDRLRKTSTIYARSVCTACVANANLRC